MVLLIGLVQIIYHPDVWLRQADLDTRFLGFDLSLAPSAAGGIHLLVPVLAGLAAWKIEKRETRNALVSAALIVNALVTLLAVTAGSEEFVLWQITENVPVYFHVDGVSRLFALLISCMWAVVGVYSFEYMGHEENENRFYLFYLISLGVLIGLVICEVILLILGFSQEISDWIAAGLFSLYIGYDVWRSQQFPKTVDNAVDSALDIYLDIANLFIRILSIMGRRNRK